MRNTNKKGFTIVELVIVVAVIAILAAVLIPTFSGIITKANLSADQQAVRQMNTALALYAAENGAPEDVIEAKKALDEQLVNVEGGLTPVTQGYAYYWDSAKNEVVLVATGDEIQDGWHILTANAYGEQISASSADELLAAFAKASEGPVSITLTSDVTLADKSVGANYGNHKTVELIESNDIVNIDLNGKTLTVDGGSNTFGIFVDKGNLTIENGTIKATSTSTKQAIRNNGGTLVLNNVVITDDSVECAVYIGGISDTSITGCEITSTGWYGIGTNSANVTNDGARISIIDTDVTAVTTGDGKESNRHAVAVMLNVVADITIDNCNFNGGAIGLLLRGNNAVVKNSKITSIADQVTAHINGENETSHCYLTPLAGDIVMTAGAGYGGDATYTYSFESVTAETVVADTDNNAELVISGIEVDTIIDGSAVTVK